MLRESLARRQGGEEGFRWRGEDVSRLEGFSDAAFAFAITLLVVSLEVPRTFDELLTAMRGFFAFAPCFALLVFVWHDHYKFFRRYGLGDTLTVVLNAVLIFIVLFYVYPLKFLFTLLIEQLLGIGTETIEAGQVPTLMIIYGAGFVAVQFMFVLLYARAFVLRDALELDARELSLTREEVQGFVLNVGVGIASIAIAILGGQQTVAWAGLVYALIFPLQTANGRLMNVRRRRSED